jgi:hypothetical protein
MHAVLKTRSGAGRLALALMLAAALPLALVSVRALALTPKDRRFVSARQGISVEAPAGWTLSLHTGYPSILVLLLHPDRSRISVAVSETPAKSVDELVELNRKGLTAQNLQVLDVTDGPRDGRLVSARAPARDESLVQLYLLRSITADTRQAIVITLAARTSVIASQRPALDFVIDKLTLEPIEIPDAGAAAAHRDRRDAGADSAGERAPEKERR